MSNDAAPQPAQVNALPSAQYVPTPEEEEALQAIPRNFLKFGGLGFAGGALATHLTLRTLFRSSVQKSYGLRYGAPIGVGALVGVVWGVKKIQEQIEYIVFDLPRSPLTNIYRKRFVRAANKPSDDGSSATKSSE